MEEQLKLFERHEKELCKAREFLKEKYPNFHIKYKKVYRDTSNDKFISQGTDDNFYGTTITISEYKSSYTLHFTQIFSSDVQESLIHAMNNEMTYCNICYAPYEINYNISRHSYVCSKCGFKICLKCVLLLSPNNIYKCPVCFLKINYIDQNKIQVIEDKVDAEIKKAEEERVKIFKKIGKYIQKNYPSLKFKIDIFDLDHYIIYWPKYETSMIIVKDMLKLENIEEAMSKSRLLSLPTCSVCHKHSPNTHSCICNYIICYDCYNTITNNNTKQLYCSCCGLDWPIFTDKIYKYFGEDEKHKDQFIFEYWQKINEYDENISYIKYLFSSSLKII